jgi:hypothetical protein
MTCRFGLWGLPLLLTVAGCLTDGPGVSLVSPDFFSSVHGQRSSAYLHRAPATEEAEKRVLVLGHQILEANTQSGLRPEFLTIGSPQTEIFHNGTAMVYVTEGLVRKCETDGQLAAVLCNELAKMVAERETLANFTPRIPDRPPPEDLPIGTDSRSAYLSPDPARLAELARYEKERHTVRPMPNPEVLAREYLQKAGFALTELEKVAPLLRAAEENYSFEKQLARPVLGVGNAPVTPPAVWRPSSAADASSGGAARNSAPGPE